MGPFGFSSFFFLLHTYKIISTYILTYIQGTPIHVTPIHFTKSFALYTIHKQHYTTKHRRPFLLFHCFFLVVSFLLWVVVLMLASPLLLRRRSALLVLLRWSALLSPPLRALQPATLRPPSLGHPARWQGLSHQSPTDFEKRAQLGAGIMEISGLGGSRAVAFRVSLGPPRVR